MDLMRNPKRLKEVSISHFERHHKVRKGRMNFMNVFHTYHKAFSVTKRRSFLYFQSHRKAHLNCERQLSWPNGGAPDMVAVGANVAAAGPCPAVVGLLSCTRDRAAHVIELHTWSSCTRDRAAPVIELHTWSSCTRDRAAHVIACLVISWGHHDAWCLESLHAVKSETRLRCAFALSPSRSRWTCALHALPPHPSAVCVAFNLLIGVRCLQSLDRCALPSISSVSRHCHRSRYFSAFCAFLMFVISDVRRGRRCWPCCWCCSRNNRFSQTQALVSFREWRVLCQHHDQVRSFCFLNCFV